MKAKLKAKAGTSILLYRIFILLLAFFFSLSGFWEITKNPLTYTKTLQMGYPPYFITTLGIAKLLGSIVLLIPNNNRLKEWAFAGFTFDVIFAFVSAIAINSKPDSIKSSIAFFFILFTYSLFIKINNSTSISPI